MDPISALGLVANIFQVIGFTSDVVAISKQIHDAGSATGLSELELIATDALNTADAITTRLGGCEPGTPDSDDSILLRLSREAVLIAHELKLLQGSFSWRSCEPRTLEGSLGTLFARHS